MSSPAAGRPRVTPPVPPSGDGAAAGGGPIAARPSGQRPTFAQRENTASAWPLAALRLTTDRLELRPDDDLGLAELANLAAAGVHPPEAMPFSTPWTDGTPEQVARSTLQYHWRCRGGLTPTRWTVSFIVRADGRVVGTQDVSATDFGALRTVRTGSWLGLAHQGRGIGTEMRRAVLAWAFDELGAEVAQSAAFGDNPASIAVSRRIGYVDDGVDVVLRRGRPAELHRFRLTAAAWQNAGGAPAGFRADGVDACRPLLGADETGEGRRSGL